jgi:hypothetical protein
MRSGARPDTVIEWLALKLNWAPVPLADTHPFLPVRPDHHGSHESWFFRSATIIACKTPRLHNRQLVVVALPYPRNCTAQRAAQLTRGRPFVAVVRRWRASRTRERACFESEEAH